MRRIFSRVLLMAAVVPLTAGMLWAVPGNRGKVQVPFDVNDLVRKASHATQYGTGPGSALGSSEFMVDTSVTWVGTPHDQCHSAVAFDGANYLVVWEDYRNSGIPDIYGARVTPAGEVLDAGGIAISTAWDDQTCPAVAFDGTNYLVVWEDYRNGGPGICGARVSQAGAVLDTGIVVSTPANERRAPAVAFDGTNCLVVWEDYRGSGGYPDIYGARVSQVGAVLDIGGIAISTAAYDQCAPAAAFDGTNYLVVWQDHRSGCDIYGARMTQAGVVLDVGGIVVSTSADGQANPAVAFDGTNCLVVWADIRGDDQDIYGARVTRAGVVLDADGIALSTATGDQDNPAVAFDGTNYLVVWLDLRDVAASTYGARVSQVGAVLDAGGIAISTTAYDQCIPAVVFGGANYLAVWDDYRSGLNADICGVRVTQAGVVLDGGPAVGIPISYAANNQCAPAVAFDGANYLVVWEDWRGGVSNIYAARVSQAGVTLDSAGFKISSSLARQETPKVAFDGTNYLLVWADYRNTGLYSDIYGARVTRAGVVLDAGGIAISTASGNQQYPAVAFDGTNYLVVWSSGGVHGARVTQAGVVLDAGGIAISAGGRPAVAFDGANYLVVWENPPGPTFIDIYGSRVSPTGAVLDPSGIAISTAMLAQERPVVAFDGTNYLVAWQDSRSWPFDDIYGARVSRAAAVLDPAGIAVCTAPNDQSNPAVAFDGFNYAILWQDARSDSSKDVYGVRMSPAGVVTDSFPVLVGPYDQTVPAIARGPIGTQLLATWQGYAGYAGSHRVNSERIWGRFLSPGADVGVARILAPTGTIDSTATITPACSTYNGGTTKVSYQVRMQVGNCYDRAASVTDHMPGTWYYVAFPPACGWTRGSLTVRCSTMLAGDLDPTNNLRTGLVTVGVPGWNKMTDLLPGGKKKNVKDGGTLAYAPITPSLHLSSDTGFVYAFKGNGTYEFYRHNTITGAWVPRDSIPAKGHSGKKKAVKKGGALTVGTDGKVFGTKGNNTVEFWCYDPIKAAGQHWSQLTDVPTGLKNLKEGVSLAAVNISGTDYIYLLRGSGTTDFYRYNTATLGWETMLSAPTGASLKPYKTGSSIVSDGGDSIYCLKGSYNEFAAYSVQHNTWVTRDNLPLTLPGSSKKTKVKDGSQIAYFSRVVYALKGGNTNEFWLYDCDDHAWSVGTELTTGAKRVKGGGALVAAKDVNALYAFRGNNTLEFWKYGPLSSDGYPLAANGAPKDVQGQATVHSPQFALSVLPNPFTPSHTPLITYFLPAAGNASLKLYGVTGGLVATLAKGYTMAGSHTVHLNANSLVRGVYLLKYENEGNTTTEKLIIE